MYDSGLQGEIMAWLDQDVELKLARSMIVKITAIPFVLAAAVIVFEIWHGS
jgi:hypothetical protein